MPINRYHNLQASTASLDVAANRKFEVTTEEAAGIRRYLYSINNGGIRRYRTAREGRILFVWRIK